MRGTFSCTGLPHSPHFFHHLWVWLLPALFSSQVVLLLLSPFSVLPGGFELPFPAIFTQLLVCSGAGTQCCYQLPTTWGMWSAGGRAGNHRGMGALGMQPLPRLDGARLLLNRKFENVHMLKKECWSSVRHFLVFSATTEPLQLKKTFEAADLAPLCSPSWPMSPRAIFTVLLNLSRDGNTSIALSSCARTGQPFPWGNIP